MSSNITSVQAFLSNFTGGGLRPNRYTINLTFPNSVTANLGSSAKISEKISFTCKAASIPASTIGVVEVPYMGRQVKFAGDKTFDDWSVTIGLDTDLVGRHVFEQWHNQIMGFDSNVSTNEFINPFAYMASGIVTLMDRAGNAIETYTVENLFPTSVGEITLGYDQNDQIAEQQVSFAINGWSNSLTS